MQKIITTIAIILLLGGLFWFFDSSDSQFKIESIDINKDNSSSLPQLGQVANLTLENYSGDKISLTSFNGQPVIINSWAVWCPFCRDELSDFSLLQSEFKEQITVIAINREEPLNKAKDFTDSINVTDNLIFLLDPEDKFYKSIGGFGMPETIFVDSAGFKRIHKRGPMDINEMRQKTNQILQLAEQNQP